MPLSRERDYLSIGEVLDTIRDEFPDVSISKIRFLEAEGLIAPERTSSGYRKFYEKDVARLRYILSLQRDHFLPLKVIRQKLSEVEANGASVPAPPPGDGTVAAPAPTNELASVQMTKDELARAAGLDDRQVGELEEFGLLGTGGDSYDGVDLTVAQVARRFFEYGLEPRHLKMFRNFAEREVGFCEQLVSPMTRRRDPSGQAEASRVLEELVGLSRRLRDAVFRARLRELL